MLKNSLIFGGEEFGEYGIIESVSRSYLPPITQHTKKIMGKDGVLYRGITLGPLTITAKIRIFDYEDQLDDFVSRLAGSLFSRQTKELNYRGYWTCYDAVLVDAEYQPTRRNRIGLMELTFNVPSGYGRGKKEIVYRNVTRRKMILDGDLPTKPTIITYNPTFQLKNLRTGEYIKFDAGNSSLNYPLVFDFDKETVTFNGQNRIDKLYRASSFFEIEHEDIIESTAPVELRFYDRYLYDR